MDKSAMSSKMSLRLCPLPKRSRWPPTDSTPTVNLQSLRSRSITVDGGSEVASAGASTGASAASSAASRPRLRVRAPSRRRSVACASGPLRMISSTFHGCKPFPSSVILSSRVRWSVARART